MLFYLLYVVCVFIFVSGATGATTQTTLLDGALFGAVLLRDLRSHLACDA